MAVPDSQSDVPLVKELLRLSWDNATRELDHPATCQFGYMFSAGTPALPVEYGLRVLATQAQMALSFEEISRDIGHDLRTGLVPTLLDFHIRLRAALYRLEHYPNLTMPSDWPNTPRVSFLGRSHDSALAVAISVLLELDAAAGRWSVDVLRYNKITGQPSVVDKKAASNSPVFIRWFEKTVSALRSVILPGVHTVDAVQLEASRVLKALETEAEKYREAEVIRKRIAATKNMECNLDCTWVRWGDQEFSFTGQQAKVVKVLWKAMDTNEGPVSQAAIGQRIKSNATQFELRKVFLVKRGKKPYSQHPAWGTMITQAVKGQYQLTTPKAH